MAVLDSFTLFADTIRKTQYFQSWAKTHGSELTKWNNYVSEIEAGHTPSPPTMSSGFGKSLVLVGQITLQKIAAGFGVSDFGIGTFGEE